MKYFKNKYMYLWFYKSEGNNQDWVLTKDFFTETEMEFYYSFWNSETGVSFSEKLVKPKNYFKLNDSKRHIKFRDTGFRQLSPSESKSALQQLFKNNKDLK